MKHWLFNEEGREYLLQEYIIKKLSTYEIADETKTYANLIRRALLFHKIELRDHQQAQKQALKNKRHPHPTKGKPRSIETRKKIGQTISKKGIV